MLGSGVKVGHGAYVKDSVLMGDTEIGAGATVNYSIIDVNVTIGAGATVGDAREKAKGITVVGEDVEVRDGATVADGEIIADNK